MALPTGTTEESERERYRRDPRASAPQSSYDAQTPIERAAERFTPHTGPPQIHQTAAQMDKFYWDRWYGEQSKMYNEMQQMLAVNPGIEYDDNGIDVNWDYRQDDRRGPNKEFLPEGAVGWTPLGEIDWGGGLSGIFKRIAFNFNRNYEDDDGTNILGAPDEVQEMAEMARAALEEGDTGEAIKFGLGTIFGYTTGLIERAWSGFESTGEKGNIIGAAARTVGAAVDATLSTLQYGAEEMVRKYVGPELLASAEILERAYERYGSGVNNEELEGLRKWGALSGLFVVIPMAVGLKIRHPELRDEYVEVVDEMGEAARMAASAWMHPASLEAFNQRVIAGEDPRLMALALQSPGAEAVLQMIIDPINFFQLGMGWVQKARKLAKAPYIVSLADDISDLQKAVTAAGNTAETATAWTKFMDRAQGIVQDVRLGLTDLAEERGIRKALARNKRVTVGGHVNDIIQVAQSHAGSRQGVDFLQTLQGLALTVADDVADAQRGWEILNRSGFPVNVATSQAGIETAIFLEKLGGEGMDFAKIEKAILASGDDLANMATEIGNLFDSTIDDAFPTATERISQNAEYVSLLDSDPAKAAEFLAEHPLATEGLSKMEVVLDNAHQVLQRALYRPMATVQGVLYMGLNPYYVVKNRWGNFVPTLLDQGPLAGIKVLTAWGADEAVKNISRMLGGVVPEAAQRGIGAIGGAVEKIGDSLFHIGSRRAAKEEARAAAHIFNGAVEEVLLTAMQEGRALETVNIVGLTDVQNQGIFDLLQHHWGNTDEVQKVLRQGTIRPGRNLSFLSKEQDVALRQLKLYDESLRIARESLTSDDAVTALAEMVAERRRLGLLTSKEAAIIDIRDLDDIGARIVEDFALEITENMGDEAGDLFTKQRWTERVAVQIAEDMATDFAAKVETELLQQISSMGIRPGLSPTQAVEAQKRIEDSIAIARGMVGEAEKVLNTQIRQMVDETFIQSDLFRNKTIKYTGIKGEPGLIRANDFDGDMARAMWDELGMPEKVGWKGVDLSIDEILPRRDWKHQLERRVWEHYFPTQSDRFHAMHNSEMSMLFRKAEEYAAFSGMNVEEFAPFGKAQDAWDLSRSSENLRLLEDGTAVYDKQVANLFENARTRYKDISGGENPDKFMRALEDALGEATAGMTEEIAGATADERWEIFERIAKEATEEGKIAVYNAKGVDEGGFWVSEGHGVIARESSSVLTESRVAFIEPEKWDEIRRLAGERAGGFQPKVGFIPADDVDVKWQQIGSSPVSETPEAVVLTPELMEFNLGSIDPPGQQVLTELATEGEGRIETARRILAAEGLPIEYEVTPFVHPQDGAYPSLTRMMHETQAPAKNAIDELMDGLVEHWDDQIDYANTPDIERQLGELFDRTSTKVTEARAQAISIGNARRDFILHNYGKRNGVDLLAGYIWPYQFWHSRTYINWMKRFISNPAILSKYAIYRKNLEQINAGMPEWMKTSINTSELFGLNTEHPLWFNLEASMNPLQGLTGVDFDDPKKNPDENWFAGILDDLNKFGPSTWTFASIAMALKYQVQGEQDAASRWAGRLYSPTQYFRDVTAMLDPKGLGKEIDPFIGFFSGGIGPYERGRVGRQLSAMVEEGIFTEAEIIDAANQQSGPIWDQARARAINQRSPNVGSVIAPFILGSGFRRRTVHDAEIDRFYREMIVLLRNKPNLALDEYRDQWARLEDRYPFMDALLLAKKDGPDRDEAMAWNILDRIPPAQSDDFAALVGMPDGVLGSFYENKGDLMKMKESDRLHFMAGIIDLAALLDVPDRATKAEWNFVRQLNRRVLADGQRIFGDDIWLLEDAFYGKYDSDNPSASDEFMALHPLLETAMNWKQELVMNTPPLAAYYTSIQRIEKYYKRQMYSDAERLFGEDLWNHLDVWGQLGDIDSKAARKYWKDHPQLDAYVEYKDSQLPIIAQRLDALGSLIPEIAPPAYREGGEGPTEEAVATSDPDEAWIDSQILQYTADLEPEEEQAPSLDEQQLMEIMGEPLFRLWQGGWPMPEIAKRRLQSLGLNEDGTLIQTVAPTSEPSRYGGEGISDDEFGPIPEDPIDLFGQELIDIGLNEVKENQGGLTKELLGLVVDAAGAKGYYEDEAVAWFIEAVGARDPYADTPQPDFGGFIPENIELGGMSGPEAMVGQQQENIFSETTALHAAVGYNKFTKGFHRLIDKIGAIATREGASPAYVWEHSSPHIKSYFGEGPMAQRYSIIHEFGHKAGDESNIDYEDFMKSVNRVLAQEQDPSSSYYTTVRRISEFPGIRLDTRGQDYEWGGPGELYASMFEWTDGIIEQVPPILRKYFRRWLK